MSRIASIDLQFKSTLTEARADYEAFVKQVEGTPVKIPLVTEGGQKATAENVATLANPGGVGAGGPAASAKLDQFNQARVQGEATAKATVTASRLPDPFNPEDQVSLAALTNRNFGGMKQAEAEQLIRAVKAENPALTTADEILPEAMRWRGMGKTSAAMMSEIPAAANLGGAGSATPVAEKVDMAYGQVRDPGRIDNVTAIDRLQSRMSKVSSRLEESRGGPNEYAVQSEFDDLQAKEAILQGRAEPIDGGPSKGGRSRFQNMRLLSVGLLAGQRLINLGEAYQDTRNTELEQSLVAGSSPVLKAQANLQKVVAEQKLAEQAASTPFYGLGAAAGAVIGSVVAPGFGTVVGAAVGGELGQGVGGLIYRGTYGKTDAIERANAQIDAGNAAVREQDRQRVNATELENRSIGVTGVAKSLSEISSDEIKLQQEEYTRRRDHQGTMASFDAVQDAAREGFRLRSREVSRSLDVAGAAVTGGATTAKRMELDKQITDLEGQYTYKTAAGALLGISPESTEQNDIVSKAIQVVQVQKRQTYLDQNTSLAQSRAQIAQGFYDVQRNQFGGLQATTGAGYLAAVNAPQENRQQLIEQATAGFVTGSEMLIRENRESTYDLSQQRTGTRQQREGYTLEGQTTLINAERKKSLRETGGTGNRVLDYLFGYTAKREEINAGADDQLRYARQDEARRIIGVQGRTAAAGYQLSDQPLDAQLSGITTSYQQQREGITSPTRLQELTDAESSDKKLAQQRYAQQVRLTDISLGYESYALDRSLARDPIGAQAAGIAGQTISRGNQLTYAGMGKEAEAERSIGIKQLELTKQNYLDAFRGREIDLRSTGVTNPRDVTDPAAVMNEIAKEEKNIRDAKFGSNGEESADSPAMKDIRELLKPLMGYIERLATGQQ